MVALVFTPMVLAGDVRFSRVDIALADVLNSVVMDAVDNPIDVIDFEIEAFTVCVGSIG